MSYKNIGESGRRLIINTINEMLSRSISRIEVVMMLVWYYELLLSAVAEFNSIELVSYASVKKYFDKTSPFVSSLKNCRDSFVHSCKMPSDRFVRDIRAYLEVTNLQYLSVISGLSLEDISLIGAIVNSL